VILATGFLITPEQLDEFFEAGAVDFIEKPIDYSELKARVKTALVLDESIKETREAKQSCLLNGQILDCVVDAAPIAIFYLDMNGRLIGCNAGLETLLRISKREMVLKSFEEFLPSTLADLLERNFSSLQESGISIQFESKYFSEGDREMQLSISLTRFGDPINSLIVGTITDITSVMVANNREKELITSSVEKLQADLEYKQRELALHTQLLIHSKSVKEELLEGVNKLQPYLNMEGKSKLFGLVKQLQRQLNEETMLAIEKKFDELHGCLYLTLEKHCPDITRNEKRLCAYLRMNHSAADIAKITSRSLNSINVGFARLRTKLKLPSNKNLKAFLSELVSVHGQSVQAVI
jgi:PAS domain-containing protein